MQDRRDIRFVQSEIIQDVRKKRVESVAHTSYFEGSERTRNSFGKFILKTVKMYKQIFDFAYRSV